MPDAASRVDLHAVHEAQAEHQAAADQAVPRLVVAAAAHGKRQTGLGATARAVATSSVVRTRAPPPGAGRTAEDRVAVSANAAAEGVSRRSPRASARGASAPSSVAAESWGVVPGVPGSCVAIVEPPSGVLGYFPPLTLDI